MINREKLKYDIALQYVQAKSSKYVEDKTDPDVICQNMIHDFALAYEIMDGYTDEFMDVLLHQNGQ